MRYKIKANKGPCEQVRRKMEEYRAIDKIRQRRGITKTEDKERPSQDNN